MFQGPAAWSPPTTQQPDTASGSPTIEFLTILADDTTFTSSNPGIFETEPKESAELNKLLKFIKTEKQTGILLIEHDMSVVMGISDHVVVLNYGKKIFEGTADQTKNSKEVIEAYLGVDE